MRWNALNNKSNFADGTSNKFIEDGERHFKNLRQLTFSGENAEAYFSPDSKELIFQAHDGEGNCDQIYTMDLKTGEISTWCKGTACMNSSVGLDLVRVLPGRVERSSKLETRPCVTICKSA